MPRLECSRQPPPATFATGSGPISVTVSRAGQFVYVTNYASNSVSAFTNNTVTGALTPTTPASFATGSGPSSVTVDPTGRFAYVANFFSATVSAYTINAATGSLTPATPASFAAGTAPHSVTVDPTGQFAYVTNLFSSSVSAYTIDAATGALTPMTPATFAAGSGPYAVTVDPTGQFAYVVNLDDGTVSAYTINSTTGALTPTTPAAFAAGSNPYSVVTSTASSCQIVVNVIGTANGVQNNVTSAVSSNESASGGTASASITVIGPPGITSTFGANSIPLNGVTSLTFTVTNLSGNALSGVGLSDSLPSGLAVANPNGLTNSCGGAPSAVVGSTSVGFMSGTVAAGGSCAFKLNVRQDLRRA